MPRLLVIKGADEGKQFDLGGPLHAIGRDARNQIRLSDTEISRHHAELRLEQGVYHLVDVGSVNGTYVNDQRIEDVVLRSGDHIHVGQTSLVYSSGRLETAPSDLADRISMITRHDLELSSAIVQTVGEAEGSRLLSRPDQANTVWLKSALANLGIMYEAIQAVSHILDIDQLLDRIMELIFRSIEADRGCIMLRNAETGYFQPKAIRFREQLETKEKMVISRTIMEHVLREKQGVLISDAARDDRFNTGQSIVRLGIREVICVPMKGRHETLGVLYLDTRSTAHEAVSPLIAADKFTGDQLALAIAIAHQAALAVEETRYHQAMLQAERLAAIGQAVAALSHHIKNILQGLRSGSDILKMGFAEKSDELLQKGWTLVQKNQNKIYDLVMDMLSYSKEREPAAEDTDVNQLVREVHDLLKSRAEELGVQFVLQLDERLPAFAVDPEGVHRALLNIAGNALDAVEGRPKPSVVFRTELEPAGDWLRLSVRDNGVGIAAEKLQDIFKPFMSTKGSRGTGLGLPVSRKILREHGGDILVESEPGQGSCFVLRLPAKSTLGSDPNVTNPELPALQPPEDLVAL